MSRQNVVKVDQVRRSTMDRGYRFVDRDPVLELVCNAITRSPLSIVAICERSGVSKSCIQNWMSGKTRRPQHITIKFVLNALGYDLVLTPMKKKKGRTG